MRHVLFNSLGHWVLEALKPVILDLSNAHSLTFCKFPSHPAPIHPTLTIATEIRSMWHLESLSAQKHIRVNAKWSGVHYL